MDQENLIEPEYYQRVSKPHRSSILKTINANVFSDDKVRKNENKRISFANNIFFQEILADGTTRVFEEPEPEKLITSPVKRPVDDLKDLSTDISIEIDSKKSKRRKFLPKSIAITYDIDDGGDKNTVYNTFANAHLSENDIEIEMHKWLQSKPMELTNIDTNDSRCSNDNMLMATRYDNSIMSNLSQEMDISLDEEQLEDSVFESTFYNMNDSRENSLSIEKKKDFSFQSENMHEEGKMSDDVSMLKSYLLDQVEEKFNCDQIKLDQNEVLSGEQIYSESQETFENKNEGENTDLNEKKMDITSSSSMRTEFGMKTCYETLTMDQTKVETNSLSGYLEIKTSERTLISNQMSTENIENRKVNSESSKEIHNNDKDVSIVLNDSPGKIDKTLDENREKEENPVIESLCPKNISIDDSNEKENIDPKNKSMLLNKSNGTSITLDLSFDLKNVNSDLKQVSNSSKNLDATKIENKSFTLENRKEIEKDKFSNSQSVYNEANESFKRNILSISSDKNANENYSDNNNEDFRIKEHIDSVIAFKNEVNQQIKCTEKNVHQNTCTQDILQSKNITDEDHYFANDANLIELSLGQTNFSFRNRSNQTFLEDKITTNDRSTISLSKLDLSLRPQLTLPSPSNQQSTTKKNNSLLKPGSFLFCNTKNSAKFSNPFSSASIKWPGRHNESSKNIEVRTKASTEVFECSKIDISSVFTQKPTTEGKKVDDFFDSRIDNSSTDFDKNATTSLSMFLHENLDKMFDSKASKSATNQDSQSPKNTSFTLEMPLEKSFSFVEYDSSNEESILSFVSPNSINNSKLSKEELEELKKQNYELSVQEPLEQSFSFVEYGSTEEASDLSFKNAGNDQNDDNHVKNASFEKCTSNLKNSYKELEENSHQNIFKSSEDSSTKCFKSVSIISSRADYLTSPHENHVAKYSNSLRETNSCSKSSTNLPNITENMNSFVVSDKSPMIMKNEKSQTLELKNNISIKLDALLKTPMMLKNENLNNDHRETITNNLNISFEKISHNDNLKKEIVDIKEKIPLNVTENNATESILQVSRKKEIEAINNITKTSIDSNPICVDSNGINLNQEKEAKKTFMNDTNQKTFSKRETFSNLSTQSNDIAENENFLNSQDAMLRTSKSLDNQQVSLKSIPYENSKQDADDFTINISKKCLFINLEKTILDCSEIMTKASNDEKNAYKDNLLDKIENDIHNKNDISKNISKNENKILSITEDTLKINHETSNNSDFIPLLLSSNPQTQNEVISKQDNDLKQNSNEMSNYPLDLSKKNPYNHENISSEPLKAIVSKKYENVLDFNSSKNLKISEPLDCRINVIVKQNVNKNSLNDLQQKQKYLDCKTNMKDTSNNSNESDTFNEMIAEQMSESPSKSLQRQIYNNDSMIVNENLSVIPQIRKELIESSKNFSLNNDERENLFNKSLLNDSSKSLNASIDTSLNENNCLNQTKNMKSSEKVNSNEPVKKEKLSFCENNNSKVETATEVEHSCEKAFTMCVDLENVQEYNSMNNDSRQKDLNEAPTYTNNDQEIACIDEEYFPFPNTKDEIIPQVRNSLGTQNLSTKNHHLCDENGNEIKMDIVQINNLSTINCSNQQKPIYKESPLNISTKPNNDRCIDGQINDQANNNAEISFKSTSEYKINDLPVDSNQTAINFNIECSNIQSSDDRAVNYTTTLSRFLQENLTQNTKEMPSEAISPELRHKTQNISLSDVVPIDKWFSFVEYDSSELFNSTIPPHSKTRDSLSCFLNAWSKSNNQEIEQSESNDTSNETNLDLELLENSLSGYFERDDTYSPSILDITRWSISDECDGNENSLFELREEFEKNMDSYLSEDNNDGLTFLLMNDEPSCRILPGDLGKYENNCVRIDFNEAVFDFSCANFRIYLEFSNNDLIISRMKWVCRVDEIGKRGFIQIRDGRHEMIRMEEKALIGMYKLAVSNEFKNLIAEMNRSKGFELLNLLERIDEICHKCESLMIEVRHIVRYRGAKFIKYIKGVYKWIYWIIGLRKPIYVCLSIDPRNYPNDYIIPEFWFPKEDRILYSSEIYQQAMLMEKPGDHTYIRRLTASTEKFIKFWKKHLIHLFD